MSKEIVVLQRNLQKVGVNYQGAMQSNFLQVSAMVAQKNDKKLKIMK
jgi:hypothetical protein